MKVRVQFMKTTVIGGIVFLVPIIVILAILGKAFELMTKAAHPVSTLVPIESIGRTAFINLLALCLIVLVCFLAGLAAKTALDASMLTIVQNIRHLGRGSNELLARYVQESQAPGPAQTQRDGIAPLIE